VLILPLVRQSLESLNIEVILGERLDLDPHSPSEPKTNEYGQRIFRTLTGREVAADLLVSIPPGLLSLRLTRN